MTPRYSSLLRMPLRRLAPAGAGKVGPAASVRQRTPYYFDYVRTLRDKACVPTREIKCQTEAMIEAAGRLVTIEDDAKLRIWDAASEAAARTESVSVHGVGPRDVTFLASASALAVTIDGNITMVPLSGGAPETHKVEHGNYPEFLFAAGTPALAVYAYRSQCGFGVVDLGSFTLAGKTPWAPACMSAEIVWSLPDPASDRFVALVTTAIKKEPYGGKELLLASYRSREIACRIEGSINDAAFSTDGDLYTAHDDGTIVRHDKNCLAKQTYRLHQGAVEQIAALTAGRMLSRSVDGALKLWSPGTTQPDKELAGLSREASIVDFAEDGSAVLILNEDRRLYLWYGEPRLGPYIGPSGPVCAGALSADRNTVYALKCEGNVELWQRQRPDE